MAFEPTDITTPTDWQTFCGRRIGKTSVGFFAAYSWRTFCLGLQLMTGPTIGLLFSVGPVCFGFGVLRLKPSDGEAARRASVGLLR